MFLYWDRSIQSSPAILFSKFCFNIVFLFIPRSSKWDSPPPPFVRHNPVYNSLVSTLSQVTICPAYLTILELIDLIIFRNKTDKCLYKYVNLLKEKQRFLLHVSATYFVHLLIFHDGVTVCTAHEHNSAQKISSGFYILAQILKLLFQNEPFYMCKLFWRWCNLYFKDHHLKIAKCVAKTCRKLCCLYYNKCTYFYMHLFVLFLILNHHCVVMNHLQQ
jgi:hypothetical protein